MQRRTPSVACCPSAASALPSVPLFDDEESFWEWYQPDDLTRWEDVIPATLPPAAVMPAVEEEAAHGLEPEPRQVLLLHDEHALSLSEVALATGRTVRETAALLEQARGWCMGLTRSDHTDTG